MKITDVRAVQPHTPGSPPDWRTQLGQILVAVDTDVALRGYGVGGGGAAGIHVVRTVLRDALLEKDAEDVEALWDHMYRTTLPFGRKGLAIMAQSGVDLALWDLRGKARREPIARCLGGEVGQPIGAYATLFGDADEALAQGFEAFKLHLKGYQTGRQEDGAIGHVEKVRRQIGPEAQLMVDAFMSWDVATTLRMAAALAQQNVAWIEEPLPPDDLHGYAQLSERCPIPIAGGEHEYTAAGFTELASRRLHHILQPDVCWCGGLTELVKIYDIARRAGLRVCPHRGAEVWALHAIAALDAEPLAESGRPWMTWVGGQPAIEGGTIQLSDAPGFGVEIDEAALS